MDPNLPGDSNILNYGFSSIDEEIAKDQMDAAADQEFPNSTNESIEPATATTTTTDPADTNLAPDTTISTDIILDVNQQEGPVTEAVVLEPSSVDVPAEPEPIVAPVAASQEKKSVPAVAPITTETSSPKLKAGWPRGKKRKIGKLKDENAPKGPLTGYVMFMNERRDIIKASKPNITFPEITKVIAAEWSTMAADTKQAYLEKAEKDKERYTHELNAYQQTEAYKLFEAKRRRAEQHNIAMAAVEAQTAAAAPTSTPAAGNSSESKESAKIPGLELPIFTEEFLQHNKVREGELRELRKLNTQYEEQNATLSKHVDELKSVVQRLEEDAAIQRNNNVALLQHLESLRTTLAAGFVSVPLPDTNEVPTAATIDNYMTKLHQIILDSPQEHEELIVTVREVVNKLNLETYVN